MRPVLARTVRFVPFVAFAAALAAQVPSPKQFLGHDVGEDRWLCNYTDLVRYFRAVDQASDRVALAEIGRTSYGQPMLMAIITSPQNHSRLAELRATAQRLCRARGVDRATAQALAQAGKAVVWIDAGLHATEAIAGQNIIELVWQMASRDDAEVRRILDEVVLLACPVNPDGLELVADSYLATGRMEPPVLYQRYVGHDNNRDYYVCNQPEAENVSRVFYRDWCPQIVYNHHQTAPAGTIIFTPPFRDPFNYYVDPNVVRGIEVVSAHMNARFGREGKPGVISRSGAPYSGWWNGGLRSTCSFHNIIGILTESFGRPEPTPINQSLDRRLPYGDYPDPVPSQEWHARQTIDYLQTANFAILDYAARCREELLLGIWTMGDRAIRLGSEDHWTPTPKLVAAARARGDDSPFRDPLLRDPRAYVLRSDQPDHGALVRFVRALQKSGVEVLVAQQPFEVAGVTAPAGSFVIRCAQAFRAHVLDMFEPQWHPDDRKDGKPVPPYDAAGWTLAMQMGIDAIRVFGDLDGPFAPLDALAEGGTRAVPGGGAGWRLDPADSHAVTAVNRLLAAKVAVERLGDGSFYVPNADGPNSNGDAVAAAVRSAVAGLGVAAARVDVQTDEVRPRLRQPRIGLFDVFGGSMPVGWDQWTLLQFEFPVQRVWGDRIARGELGADFDALVFHAGLPGPRDLGRAGQQRDPETLQKLQKALPPFEDWSDLAARATPLVGETAVPALRQFVERGGTLIALGGECEKVIRHFGLPIRVGTYVPDPSAEGGVRPTRREEFYIPGSLLALDVDLRHPLAAGMRQYQAAMFNANSPVFEVTGPGPEVVAHYRVWDTLVSGWALGDDHLAGKAAIVAVPLGKGRIVLFGADVTYRGQPVGTFKPLFQALLQSAMTSQ
jgi:hypothetical protein